MFKKRAKSVEKRSHVMNQMHESQLTLRQIYIQMHQTCERT